MAKIIVLMLPEPGHLIPTLALASKLRQRNHDVTFITAPVFEKDIRARGFRCLTFLSDLFTNQGAGLFSVMPISKQARDLADQTLDSKGYGLSLLLRAIISTDPDLLLIDRCLDHIRPFFQQLRLREVIVSTNFGDALPPPWRRDGVAPVEIVLCPQEFGLPADREMAYPRYYVEPSMLLDRPASSFPWHLLDPAKPLLYCTLGTQVGSMPLAGPVMNEIIEIIAARNDCQVVASIGNSNGTEPRELNQQNTILVSAAPQLDILQRATAVITHGGLGTIKEAIMHGVPLVVLPFVHDQPANGARVAYHNLGIVCDPYHWSRETFSSAFTKFMREIDSFRPNLSRMRDVMIATEETAPSIEVIESVIRADFAGNKRKKIATQ